MRKSLPLCRSFRETTEISESSSLGIMRILNETKSLQVESLVSLTGPRVGDKGGDSIEEPDSTDASDLASSGLCELTGGGVRDDLRDLSFTSLTDLSAIIPFILSCSSSKSTKFFGASTCSFVRPETARDLVDDTARFVLDPAGDEFLDLEKDRCGRRYGRVG